VHVIDREMRPVFDFRNCHPGDRYRLTQRPDGSVLAFRYYTGPDKVYRLALEGEGYRAWSEERKLHTRQARLAGVIESSLYDSIRSLGEQPSLAQDFADLFAWDVDFSRGVQPGDDFQILYERLYRVDEDGVEDYVRPGRILAARYRNSAGEHSAYWFEDQAGGGRYYRGDGTSIERAFLAAPLQFSRISSKYTSARLHPILNITRPHYGIDYAAAEGTPIWAVADGTVIYRGWGGSFGNLIKIRHSNGYVSYYSHLSGFEKDLRVGQRVKQKQVIGRVGHTGLATGPHVCFRVAKDGRYVNPMSIRSPAGKSVSDELWIDFQIVRDGLIAELEGETLAATEEAL
jgi:murein DD-endopeptidase MepM/ murein hydrolase activator NlpD